MLEVATWALAKGHTDEFRIAITAGLRIFPGQEELLGLQADALHSYTQDISIQVPGVIA